MAQLSFETKVDADAEKAWGLAGSFGGLENFFPGVESCEVEGDVRTLQAMGATIRERELERDDAERRYAYSIIESPFEGLTHHKATVRVEEDGEASVVIYEVEIEPDEMAGAFEPIYQGAVDALKSAIER
jgi:carbon monoxide dehydrogenase subunit G